MSFTFAVAFALTSGISATLSSVAIAYPAHRARVRQEEQSWSMRLVTFVLNQVFVGVAAVMGFLASGQGPVAVVFPCSVAASLASNMVLQQVLGIAQFTKNSRVGGSLLVASVVLISQMGPGELSPDVDVFALLTARPAIGFISCVAIILLCSICALACKLVTSNGTSLLLYVVVGAVATVLNTSISKALQMDLNHYVKIALVISYVALGSIAVASEMFANSTLEDASLFVPMSNGVNLVTNCLAGLFIWGDLSRLSTSALNYLMIYIIVVEGTYLVSKFDMFRPSAAREQTKMYKGIHTKMLRKKVLADPLLKAAVAPSKIMSICDVDVDAKSPDFEKSIRTIVDNSLLSHKEITELLMKEPQTTSNYLSQKKDEEASGRRESHRTSGTKWIKGILRKGR